MTLKIYQTGEAVEYDNLIGGHGIKPWLSNVSLATGVETERGTLLARGSNGEYSPAESVTADATYAIATEGVGSSSDRVTTVYQTGIFNREALVVGSSINLSNSEHILQKQGIFLTKSQEV